VIIIDTGPLVALVNSGDIDHEPCVRWIETVREPVLVPNTVLAEVCYLLERRCGSLIEARFLRDLADDDRFALVPILREDLIRVAELVETYRDFPLGGTDASIITLAERLGVARIATLDRRHFTVVRPKHIAAFTLVPT
jgi:predicted nucleic acid-binding protein